MSDNGAYLGRNVKDVLEKVEKAANKSGRKLEDICVIAVTKTIDTDRISKVMDEGMIHLGENRVQEFCEKYDIISKNCNWHLIGHLQTNKVKYIIDKISMIHSVDRMELAQEIDKKALKAGKVMDVLVQVNVAGEESKFGISPDTTLDFVKRLSSFQNLRVRGLMTVAPFVDDPEEIRGVFRELNKIFIDIKKENIDNIYMDYLSMGMSNDFEVAIEEGSNMVRIGTAIFGKREYK
ncbi:MAG: YggS family pyridoxal phosphate-dependent enzyme [Clostridia bacterium]|nr:YggS family pyridoxal phosphate-dependent enzyme [Clostridia bacterium]